MLDAESQVMLYEGLNLSQLGILFHMDHRVLVEKLYACPPTGRRNNTDIWELHLAAPHLVKPIYDIESYIKRMHHNDLPKHLTKEFWAGLRSKQEYMKQEGDLWPTAKVVEVIGGLMKLMKMNVRLMADSVDRQAELTDRQRALVKGLGDNMLEELYRAVVDAFDQKPTNPGVQEAAGAMLIAAKMETDDEL